MTLMISPAARDALEGWLASSRALNGTAENTLTAYRTDVVDFIAFLTEYTGEAQGLAPLARITVPDMRAWMARVSRRAPALASRRPTASLTSSSAGTTAAQAGVMVALSPVLLAGGIAVWCARRWSAEAAGQSPSPRNT